MPDPSEQEAPAGYQTGRRKFLKIMGGGVIFAAGAAALYAGTRTPTKALEPWKLALGPQSKADARHIILSHAILAPNPHNRQPWLADLSRENEIHLFCDLERRLPHTDPFDRQITIGLGCFLELADITARQIGVALDIELFPEGEPQSRLDKRPVARIVLSQREVTKDPLFAVIFDRRSHKEPFETDRLVSREQAAEIMSVAYGDVITGSTNDSQKVVRLREIAWKALYNEMATHATMKESIDLMRIGRAEIEANPDGISMGGVFLETAGHLGFLTREKLLEAEPGTSLFQQSLDAQRPMFDTANSFVYVITRGNSRAAQIAAGRSYVRLNLKATELGIQMHPLSQALQEFDEVAVQYQAIRNELGIDNNQTLQMFARTGYGEKQDPSPRWEYQTRIKDG